MEKFKIFMYLFHHIYIPSIPTMDSSIQHKPVGTKYTILSTANGLPKAEGTVPCGVSICSAFAWMEDILGTHCIPA